MSRKNSVWRQADGRPMVIAHGDESGCGLYPGNTLFYLCKMVALGVDALELDLNLTADGHLVLMHDVTLERTTNGRGLIREHTLAQLRGLNAAYHWSQDGENYPYREQPLSVSTIDEVFAEIPDTPLIIELKNNDPEAARAMSRAIDNAGSGDRVIVSSFHHRVIHTFRYLSPSVMTGVTMREALLFYLAQWVGLTKYLPCHFQAMQLPTRYFGLKVYSLRFIEAARRQGLHLSVWTVDDPEQMKYYVARGIDGIVTNRPDRLLKLLAS